MAGGAEKPEPFDLNKKAFNEFIESSKSRFRVNHRLGVVNVGFAISND